jgi:hypothetical protein
MIRLLGLGVSKGRGVVVPARGSSSRANQALEQGQVFLGQLLLPLRPFIHMLFIAVEGTVQCSQLTAKPFLNKPQD